MSFKLIPEDVSSTVESVLGVIEGYLVQKPIRKTLESDVMKELKKLRSVMTQNKDHISEDLRRAVAVFGWLILE